MLKGNWFEPNLQGIMFHVNLQGCICLLIDLFVSWFLDWFICLSIYWFKCVFIDLFSCWLIYLSIDRFTYLADLFIHVCIHYHLLTHLFIFMISYVYIYISIHKRQDVKHPSEICCSHLPSLNFFHASNDHLFTRPTKVENYAKEKPDPRLLTLEFLPPNLVVFII